MEMAKCSLETHKTGGSSGLRHDRLLKGNRGFNST